MLQQTNSLRLDKLINHIAENGTHGIKSLVGVADIRQASLVQQDLLNDEDGDGFREFRPCLHDAEAKGYNFRGEKEVDDGVVVVLLVKNER